VIGSLINKLTILPRWIIVFIDLAIIFLAASIGYLLRFNFDLEEIETFKPLTGITFLCLTGLVATLATRSYAGIVRYTGVEDGIRIMYASLLSLILACMINLIYFYNEGKNLIPYSVLFISFFTSFLFLFYYRLIVKTVFSYYKGEIGKKTNVAIFGAGSLGLITKNVIETDSKSKNKVVAFFEDDERKIGKVMNGIRIHPGAQLEKVIRNSSIKELIISVKELTVARKNELVECCISNDVKVRIVPPAEKWVRGEFKLQQIKEVNIEDLLGRESIQLDEYQLVQELEGKSICITGAAGSIGSEIVRQLINYNPSELILIDQAESPLYEIEREVKGMRNNVKIKIFVADITNEARITIILSEVRPEIIFHAAAYKHVPMMEGNPSEAVQTNILGTKILADLAVTLNVRKFVMVSTDKAVNPTNVMGCSKRIAEIYVQALDSHGKLLGGKTQFVTTRFGNVLGSNGSVIPTFKQQIQSGGPVTVTHPEIRRFFMTIPEACRLVLEAGVIGQGGEIFIFDMGQPIKIVDLAKKMIRLSGFDPGKDIEIVFTGLREGEKLYEELLNNQEDTIPTHHQKILKAKVQEYDYAYILSMIELFRDLINDKNELKMVTLMKEIVPEFKSNYSRYQVLDNG
jgi:FlaA1/EpsC-like NDP-sugar epimerase